MHQRTVRYQVDSARAGLLRDELASSEASAQALRLRAGQTESLLRQEALLSYADALPVVGAGGQSSRDLMEATDQATYLALTVGDISGTLDLLKSEQSQLARTVATSRLELQSAIEAESSAAQARLLALREAASLQVLLSRAESQVAALTSAERSPTGPPVGNGIVKALAQQLGATPANPRSASIGTSPHRAATGLVTTAVSAPLAKQTHKAASARKAALSNGPRTRATTTAELATTTRTTTVLRPTTTTSRPTTTNDGPTTTGRATTTTDGPTTRAGQPTTTTDGPTTRAGQPTTSTELTPTTTTTATAAGAVGAAARTPHPAVHDDAFNRYAVHPLPGRPRQQRPRQQLLRRPRPIPPHLPPRRRPPRQRPPRQRPPPHQLPPPPRQPMFTRRLQVACGSSCASVSPETTTRRTPATVTTGPTSSPGLHGLTLATPVGLTRSRTGCRTRPLSVSKRWTAGASGHLVVNGLGRLEPPAER